MKFSSSLTFGASILLCSGLLCAQAAAAPAQSNPNAPAAAKDDKVPPSIDGVLKTVPGKEQKAFKQFRDVPQMEVDKKIQLGEEFVQKYPSSVMLPSVYSTLAVACIEGGKAPKGYEYGEKALALQPNDMRTTANLAQSMARLFNPADPNAEQQLVKAQQYAEKVIKVTPTLQKPDDATADEFTTYNNVNLSMAHSALGTIDLRRGKNAEAFPELQQTVQLDGGKNATNEYLFGVASLTTDHFAEALDAFNKCVALNPGNLLQTCKDNAAEAQKKLGAKK